MTRVWLIRHGEPAAESRQRCYGSLDVALSPEGRQQMRHVAARLKVEPVAAIYASPLSRARESAAIVASATGQSVAVAEDLREIAFGDWEGLTYAEIERRDPELYRRWMETPTEVSFPNGESFAAMRTRVVRAFAAILDCHADQTIALVSHGGVNRILLAHALQMPDHAVFRLAQDYAAMNLLTFTQGFPVVQVLNLAAQPECDFTSRGRSESARRSESR